MALRSDSAALTAAPQFTTEELRDIGEQWSDFLESQGTDIPTVPAEELIRRAAAGEPMPPGYGYGFRPELGTILFDDSQGVVVAVVPSLVPRRPITQHPRQPFGFGWVFPAVGETLTVTIIRPQFLGGSGVQQITVTGQPFGRPPANFSLSGVLSTVEARSILAGAYVTAGVTPLADALESPLDMLYAAIRGRGGSPSAMLKSLIQNLSPSSFHEFKVDQDGATFGGSEEFEDFELAALAERSPYEVTLEFAAREGVADLLEWYVVDLLHWPVGQLPPVPASEPVQPPTEDQPPISPIPTPTPQHIIGIPTGEPIAVGAGGGALLPLLLVGGGLAAVVFVAGRQHDR